MVVLYMFTLLFLVLGIVTLVFTARGKAVSSLTGWVMGIYFTLTGILLGVGIYLKYMGVNTDRYYVILCGGGIGGLMLGLGFLNIVKLFLWKDKVDGVFEGVNRYHCGRGSERFAPIFSYEYKGKTYKSQCMDTYGKRKVSRKFLYGQKYPIYLYEKNPMLFRTNTKPTLLDFSFIIWGTLFIMGAICTY